MKRKVVALCGFGLSAGLAFVAPACGGAISTLTDAGTDGSSGSSGGLGSASSSGVVSSASSSGVGSTSSSGVSSSGSGASSGVVSSSSSGGASSSSSGATSSSSGTTSSSSGSSSSSSSSGSSSGGNEGLIVFEQCEGASICGTSSFSFFANFAYSLGAVPGCKITPDGPCAFYSCSTANPAGPSAGTLTITGGKLGSVQVTPTNGSYNYQASGAMFGPGDTLTVSATGGTIPAFGPQAVVAPGLVSLDVPVPTSNGTYSIPTSSDLVVAWSGGQSGAVMFFEGTAGNSSTGTQYFLCRWDATVQKAVVPQARLAPLANQSQGAIAFGQYDATTFAAGSTIVSEWAMPFSGAMAKFQ